MPTGRPSVHVQRPRGERCCRVRTGNQRIPKTRCNHTATSSPLLDRALRSMQSRPTSLPDLRVAYHLYSRHSTAAVNSLPCPLTFRFVMSSSRSPAASYHQPCGRHQPCGASTLKGRSAPAPAGARPERVGRAYGSPSLTATSVRSASARRNVARAPAPSAWYSPRKPRKVTRPAASVVALTSPVHQSPLISLCSAR